MTDEPTSSEKTPAEPLTNSPWAYLQLFDDHQDRREQTLPINKAAILDALAGAGITIVVVNFDGYGDSGQIENIEVRNSKETVDLPAHTIDYKRPIFQKREIEKTPCTVRDAIEALTYDLLGQTHGGWENNDGAYGDVTFDVETKTITLDYHERYTASENYWHEF